MTCWIASRSGKRDGIDEQRAAARPAQLHQIRALAVAVARSAFGVDGDGTAARRQPRYGIGKLPGVGDDVRNTIGGLGQ